MLYVSVPFREQFANRTPRRMKYDHFRNIAKRKSGGARARSPIVILCEVHASEPTNFFEIRAAHNQITRPRVSVLFNIQFKLVCKNAFICLKSGKC